MTLNGFIEWIYDQAENHSETADVVLNMPIAYIDFCERPSEFRISTNERTSVKSVVIE